MVDADQEAKRKIADAGQEAKRCNGCILLIWDQISAGLGHLYYS